MKILIEQAIRMELIETIGKTLWTSNPNHTILRSEHDLMVTSLLLVNNLITILLSSNYLSFII